MDPDENQSASRQQEGRFSPEKKWDIHSQRTPLLPPVNKAFARFLAEYSVTDPYPPFSEQTLLSARARGAGTLFHAAFCAETPSQQLDPGGSAVDPWMLGAALATARPGGGYILELAVLPDHRGRGIGTDLLRRLCRDAGSEDDSFLTGLHAWSHGSHPAAERMASRFGFIAVRELFQMRLNNLAEAVQRFPAPQWPQGVRLRPFRPGEDEQELLAVNAAAFAQHPEQGALTITDLRARMAQPWFDPAGLLLAVHTQGAAEQLLGFHWTKVAEPGIGEVYVVGVAPAAQGSGLGRALTLAGLAHLAGRGLETATLYVDGGNTAARRLYRKFGFQDWGRDTLFAKATRAAPQSASQDAAAQDGDSS